MTKDIQTPTERKTADTIRKLEKMKLEDKNIVPGKQTAYQACLPARRNSTLESTEWCP